MSPVLVIVASYFLGGITFIPILALLLFAYGAIILPRDARFQRESRKEDSLLIDGDDECSPELKAKLEDTSREADVAASYFAVCREYVPGGINGKPPERTTPAGETIATESPSVYQSMYRSIFDRNKSQTPTIEAGKPVKKARNVFYVVLRHGHLMLFDDSDQVEVRHVIALVHYNVDVYGGDEEVPEGELYIKRNSIRLSKKVSPRKPEANLAPFYLFSDNCSEKEDFYHALLNNQRKLEEPSSEIPLIQSFGTEDMIKLIRLLHVSDENLQSRWLNAFIGRIFLALYKTPEVENRIRTKIKKKIARASKPAFITSLALVDIGMGESAPMFQNIKLRDINIDGGLTLESDVRYTGKFKAVISAVAKIELGQRFKPREVDLVLSGVLNRLDGHVLIRIKPPPSNRIWVSFETMPKLELAIEPIVSSRQITYGVILRAIESRVREVFAETLVLPNWDDFPFTNTESQKPRGGIWERDSRTHPPDSSSLQDNDKETPSHTDESRVHASASELRNSSQPNLNLSHTESATALEKGGNRPESISRPESPAEPKPTPLRSNSFAAPAMASPAVVTKIPVASDKTKKRGGSNKRQDSSTALRSLSTHSQEGSPISSPTRSQQSLIPQIAGKSSPLLPSSSETKSEVPSADDSSIVESSGVNQSRSLTQDSTWTGKGLQSTEEETQFDANKEHSALQQPASKAAINDTIISATAAAKKWGIGVMHRSRDSEEGKIIRKLSESEPIGRGMPLPPPGEPLPGPEPRGWGTGAFGSFRRRPGTGSSVTSIPTLSNLFAGSTALETPKATNKSRSAATGISEANDSRQGDNGINNDELSAQPSFVGSTSKYSDEEEHRIIRAAEDVATPSANKRLDSTANGPEGVI